VPDLEQFSMGAQIGGINRFQLPSRDPRSIASTFGYAYQFDATLFAPYLRQLAEGSARYGPRARWSRSTAMAKAATSSR
jgi:hypothetical protein